MSEQRTAQIMRRLNMYARTIMVYTGRKGKHNVPKVKDTGSKNTGNKSLFSFQGQWYTFGFLLMKLF